MSPSFIEPKHLIHRVCQTSFRLKPKADIFSCRISINYLLVNLAVADITFAVFLAPKFILSQTFTHPDGAAGKALCRFLTGGTLGWLGGVSSAFTLVVIAVERYFAVMYPLGNKGRLTKRKLKVRIDTRHMKFRLS